MPKAVFTWAARRGEVREPAATSAMSPAHWRRGRRCQATTIRLRTLGIIRDEDADALFVTKNE